jgi:hypothetical protein
MSEKSDGEKLVEEWLEDHRIPFVTQYRFHPVRKWTFDFAIGGAPVMVRGRKMFTPGDASRIKLAIEVEGGQFTGGHKRGPAADSDCEKFNEATLLGWRVLRFTSNQVKRGVSGRVIQRAWVDASPARRAPY